MPEPTESEASTPIGPKERASIDIRAIFRRYRAFSMMGRPRFLGNLALASATKLDMSQHAVVECGVWKGGASFAMMDLFSECTEFHLFDSFEGLPDPTERDGQRAIDLSNKDLFIDGRNYASHEEIIANVEAFGFAERCTVHKGWFEDTVHATAVERPIGILRLDGDWYDSTLTVLERLFDRVAPGGLIIIDDYYDWPGCSQAVHDFLSARKAPEALNSHKGSIAYMKKRSDDFLTRPAARQEVRRRTAREKQRSLPS